MARHFPARTGQIQTDPPKATPPAAEPPPPSPAAPNPAIPWGWQVALFVWLASFGFLFLNDLLQIVFKFASRLRG
jgi:hypothetical protein